VTTPDLFGTSPFDAIRQVLPDGSERWSARDLQLMMGYARWENFEVPIRRAMKAAENQGLDVEHHFLRSQKNPSSLGGRPSVDYLLTRHAAYLVAMNGDPNKPECAEGQGYFSIMTRQAEVAPPAAIEMSDDELMLKALSIATRRVEALTARAEVAEAKVIEAAPKVEAYDELMSSDGTFTMEQVANELMPVTGLGPIQLRAWLRGQGVLKRDNTPYSYYSHQLWFKVNARSYERDGREVPYTVTTVYPKGVEGIRRLWKATR